MGPKPSLRSSIVILLVLVVVMGVATAEFRKLYKRDVVVNGPGVTRETSLSEYFDGLKGTVGDSRVFVLEGAKPGGTVLVMGGVHPNEVSGWLSAIMLVENAKIEKGRVIVIPQVNGSGFTYQAPREGAPYSVGIKTAFGERRFRYGDRLTSPLNSYPDPEVYVHYPSGQFLSGNEVRNLDRAFPGKKDGMITEKIAYGVTELVKRENVDLVIDLHEARPMNPITNCIISHERAMTLASLTAMNLEGFEGLPFRVEPSPKNMHGLSHRELGDHTQALAVLMETPNPAMDWLRGPTTEGLVIDGQDEFYAKAAKRHLIYVPYPKGGLPLAGRVGRHLSGIQELVLNFSSLQPDKEVVVQGLPKHADVVAQGIGAYLRNPGEAR